MGLFAGLLVNWVCFPLCVAVKWWEKGVLTRTICPWICPSPAQHVHFIIIYNSLVGPLQTYHVFTTYHANHLTTVSHDLLWFTWLFVTWSRATHTGHTLYIWLCGFVSPSFFLFFTLISSFPLPVWTKREKTRLIFFWISDEVLQRMYNVSAKQVNFALV